MNSIFVLFGFALAGSLIWILYEPLSSGAGGFQTKSQAEVNGPASTRADAPVDGVASPVLAHSSPLVAESHGARFARHAALFLAILFGLYDLAALYWATQNLTASFLVLTSFAAAGSLAWRFRSIASRILKAPVTINLLTICALSVVCVYLYSGFAAIFFPITQDHIPAYIGARYALAHPDFALVLGYPNRLPLWLGFAYLVQSLTQDAQWLAVIASLAIHIASAFVVFRIAGVICGERAMIPRLVAALLFLISVGHRQTVLVFAHSYPLLNNLLALLSIYFFLKVCRAGPQYKRADLYLSVSLAFLSFSSGSNFVALPALYILVMAIRWKWFRRDIIWTVIVVVAAFGTLVAAGYLLGPRYGIMELRSGPLLSPTRLEGRIQAYPHSFLSTLSLFFPGFSAALATFFYGTTKVLANIGDFDMRFSSYFSSFLLLAPLGFADKRKAVLLYGLIAVMLLLFLPFILAPRALNQRHVLHLLSVAALYMGLLTHYVFEAIKGIKAAWLLMLANWAVVLFWAVFGVRLAMVSRNEIKQFIEIQSSASASIEDFMKQFELVRVADRRQQIYFLTTRIPETASFIGNPAEDCYYFYYLATKFKGLPIDLYPFVFRDLEIGEPLDEAKCSNYFIKIADKAAFGYFTDRDNLEKTLKENPDVRRDDVIVLTWRSGLRQRRLSEGDL
ncbi:MAG: hypothetical protein HYX74_08820 [Acidobacteria bacterium]|nr:hypothetical protein [Acidobacteriota bacterium]